MTSNVHETVEVDPGSPSSSVPKGSFKSTSTQLDLVSPNRS
ncbi:unnamed protein product [Fusarium venenatum]|uniref:Uncharacterized protein n=1 Tax=Fusarium venenatum TaxID=56646 RepID=A0A2L2U028_9HYPO|nr:uncharacterized protein FVRRES_03487 [Fusarium venenatum]CEI66975.1 unnamed protein product [Fusarium venenatum]